MTTETRVYMTYQIQVHVENLKRAKAAIADWESYRLSVEQEILAFLERQGVALPESGSVEVGENLQIVCSTRRDWKQGCLATFVDRHPDQVGVTLVKEWKPISKEGIDNFLSSAHPGAAELLNCFSEKPIKPSFRLK